MKNPYIARSPVKNTDVFYGRDEIMKRILRDVTRKQMQSHCIIGERRIGKTSLLFQIMNNQVREKYVGKIKFSIFVGIDITLFPNAPPAAFFEEWARGISKISGQALSAEPGYLSFRKYVESVTEAGYKIIILIDEFEATRTNSSLDRGFFEFLRALTQNYNISFILFSRVPLQHLIREEKFSGKFSSPFFNALNISYLKFLEESAAKSLITEPAQKAGTDITDFADFILEQVYHHPFLIQLLSSIVFDHKQSSETNHEKILREFNTQTEEFFTYLWQHSSPEEQEALKKLTARDQDIPKTALDNLDRRSIIIRNEENKIFCPSFEEFVKKQI
ncbi:MAG: ATP-binding protein [Theionarchaea archaeon]|nr:ATP-binding protein [Theionarchaea archaeon]